MEKKEIKMQSVYNLVIMDKSGSMAEIRNAAIEGFNDVLSGVRKLAKDYADTKNQKISLVLFETVKQISRPLCNQFFKQVCCLGCT